MSTMAPSASREGGCMCGAVRYVAAGEPQDVINCHCESCRRHTGAPMAYLAVYPVEAVTFSGTPRKVYGSSPDRGRAFCTECGTSMTWETELPGRGVICALHISTFDDPDALEPNAHSFYGERICWFDAHDDLPRHDSFIKSTDPVCYGPAKRS